ncbi:3',5'-cyclic adenosine monophosphate phosphodiesterase CpdA [Pseudomonas sp. 31 R 17]|uniref:phosphodiesterase n=1 Tax=Pseudomonas TaxID=286 RepID=UPI000811ED54|nr:MULTISPECIES: phosphodiesterase [Pseudomonas]MDO4238450.1 phosphodiesterase [Pseudomonas sp.]RZI18632.1 phosphodiesterase [Pseudomonas orientalis]CRM46725.1 3',5'-cyclic adenosine monophosphate phosphodiesterase CpdA [Pseudomonas sp. 28 E 9]CRM73780.1 3',5'-cyclic adenosine monophosphate phosphodiesterase CpdA [Pseudomonas sp. 31 R 17]
MNRPFIVAQISDLHLKAGQRLTYGVVDTLGALRRAVDHLNASQPRPDIVVISGDLVDFGRADEYAVLHPELARLHMPCYLVPGNHDARGPLLDAFGDHAYLPLSAEGPLDWVVDTHPLRLIGLDSTIPGSHGGQLLDSQLHWLDEQLALRPQAPTLLILHHPPFISGIGHMDREPFINAAALERVVARHPQVERLLCGHLHRPMQRRFGASLSCVCPGTSHQIVLDLQDAAPAHFNLEPAGYLLHRWDAQQGLISHNGVFGDYPGPYPFYDAHGLID